MAHAFGKRLRELRSQRQVLQATFAEKCRISAAYLSDIERGKRNPPADKVILEWATSLDPGSAEDIGQELVSLAARDRDRAEALTEDVVEEAGTIWESAGGSGETATPSGRGGEKSGTPFLDHFGVDLLELARQGRFDPAPGRSREIAQIAGVVSCRRRNSAVLTCDSGALISHVAQGLACAMAAGQVPEPLAGIRLLRPDGLQAGVKYRGQLEERVRALVDETVRLGDVLLYFHSLGDLVDLEKSLNGSILAPALEEGILRIITGAVRGDMDRCLKLNRRLVDCFRPVSVHPLDRDGILGGLYELRQQYGDHHGVAYADGALVAIVDASDHGDETGFWQRSLDLLDAVGAHVKLLPEKHEVTVEDVDEVATTSE